MNWLAEDLNEDDHSVGLTYSLKQNLNLHVKMAQCQYLMESIIHQ